MADQSISTTREALMAELIIDANKLLERFEKFDASFSERIAVATQDATSKGFLNATMRLKQLTDELESALDQASVRAVKTLNAETKKASDQVALLFTHSTKARIETFIYVSCAAFVGCAFASVLF